jgi:phosphate transport system substrate-binding protein
MVGHRTLLCQRIGYRATEDSPFCNLIVNYVRVLQCEHRLLPIKPTSTRVVWIVYIVCCCLAWQALGASGTKRLYVEPFTINAASGKLREHVISEMRKLRSIALVANESDADVVLGGGGEIWVKGYRSLNPRSGRSPEDGNPVYAGYLSVELKDAHGRTLWSYLVTPGATSADVSKDLAQRISKHVAEALERTLPPSPTDPAPAPALVLKGAGATFPYPVYAKWFANYQRENPNLSISYDPVGSEAGVRELLAARVDFGASDCPDAIRDIAPSEEGKYLYFPSVVGAVVPIVNLPGFAGDLSFTPEALAGIYLGRIRKWNDPLLQQANRGVHLPDLDIVVVHRADGSGTSYAWSDFLTKTSSEWKSQVGSSLAPKWPTGRAAKGNDGVAKLVKELGGSIGYVEFIYALQNHLGYGKVRNRSGEFVEASLRSIEVAAGQSAEMNAGFKVSLVNSPAPGAYPIASFTWFVFPAHFADESKRTALASFLRWMLGPGQTQAAALGYVALPKDVVEKETSAILDLK